MKRVLILGASSGIAKSLAYELARNNINLLLAGRNLNDLESMCSDIKLRYQVEVNTCLFQALDYKSHQSFFDECLNMAGDLDTVFLAYGYLGEQKTAEQDFNEASKIIDTNFTSAVSILNIIANYFEQKENGLICVLSSVAGDRGRQSNYIYGSAKGALSLYLQGLRNRLHKSGVNVTTIKPGFVDTKMTYGTLKDSPLVASPEQIAKAIYSAMLKKKDTAYVLWFWKWIMFIIVSIPERIFKKLSL